MARKMQNNDDGDGRYKSALRELQIELVKLQRDLIQNGSRVLVIVEGRDAAGKDGTIKRLTEHMSPRETRIHAPGKPSDREESEWYFQRFVPFLPSAGEFVFFNRSWYNRAGVESVMGFAKSRQVSEFLDSVVPFEEMLVRDGLNLRKYYLDISRKEQKKRLADRQKDPLKQWKISPIDEAALSHWSDYSNARDRMLERTSHPHGEWTIVQSDEKKPARLEVMRDLLSSFSYPGKAKKRLKVDRDVVYPWTASSVSRLSR